MLKQKHTDLSLSEKQRKLLYISELLMKDLLFDADVRKAMAKALKRCPDLPKLITLSEFEEHEILDINNPIQKT